MNKPKQVNITRRLIFGFCGLISIFLLFGMFTLCDIHRISDLSRTIYNHPLVVSNAALQSNVSITKMHRNMKDVVLYNSLLKVQKFIVAMNEEEKQVYTHLDIVKNRIIGEEGKALEIEARNFFDAWRPIRKEVIGLVTGDQREKAVKITTGKGANHVALLEEKMLRLTKYAREKASDFMHESERVHSRLNMISIFLLLFGIFTSFLVAFFTIKYTSSAEKELQESENNLRDLMENVPAGVTVSSPEGVVYEANLTVLKLFGYDSKEDFFKTPAPSHYYDKKERERFVELHKKGLSKDFESQFIRKDGTVFWGTVTSLSQITATGATRDLNVFQDITERKQAEKALWESEEKYRTILESIEDGYYEVDLAGNLTFFNDSICKILGYTNDELMGMNNRQYTEKENAKRLYQTFNRVYKAGKPTKIFDWEIIRKDTTKGHVEASVSLIKDTEGQPIGFRGIARDVTERKLAEEALRSEEEKIRVLTEKSPLGISLIGEDGHYEYLNPKFIEMFGYTLADIPAGRDWFIKAYPDSRYRHEVISTWIDDLEKYESGESRSRSFKVSCKDGSEKEVYFRSVTMEAGEHFVICEDITERTQLEAQLQRAEKMEAIGTLAGGVAHDLNNVLSGIVSYPDLLLMDLPEDSPLRKPVLTIQKSGKKAADIVQDLLTLARRGVVASEVVNVNQIINSYLSSPEHEKLREFHPDAKIESDLETNLLNIMGSPVHLSKTVMNLVTNAAEAMPDGGNIFISTESKYIDNPIRGYDDVKEGDYVILTVSDTGIGISSEDMERIFEPFYTKKVMGRSGTGLGMAVVWGTVKDHKGYIDIQSTEGKGTTFTLYFPVTRKEISGQEEALPIEDYMGKGESILVVDDVEEQREIASRILKKLGYSVTTVSSGEEAVDYLKDNPADLLILDMIMDPGIDGLETYKRILKLHPNQKAIIASGFSETDRVKEAQRLGAGKYIKKPYTLEKIGIAVRDELEK